MQRITENYYLVKRLNRIEVVRVYNKPLCVEYLNEFKIYNCSKTIEELRFELTVNDLEYLDSQATIKIDLFLM